VAQRAASHEFQNLLSGVVISPKNKSVIVILQVRLEHARNAHHTHTRARLISLSSFERIKHTHTQRNARSHQKKCYVTPPDALCARFPKMRASLRPASLPPRRRGRLCRPRATTSSRDSSREVNTRRQSRRIRDVSTTGRNRSTRVLCRWMRPAGFWSTPSCTRTVP